MRHELDVGGSLDEVAELRRALAREKELRAAAEEHSFIADADEVPGDPTCLPQRPNVLAEKRSFSLDP